MFQKITNQQIFIIGLVLCVGFIYFSQSSDTFTNTQIQSQSQSQYKYNHDKIDCNNWNNKKSCEKGYQCVWIEEQLKPYPLNTPFCTGNILYLPQK